MLEFFSRISHRQKIWFYSILFLAVGSSGVYWFYATNKSTIVKIKYRGIEGLAVLSKKDMQDFGDGIRRWSEKRTFHINLLNSAPIESMQNTIKNEINHLEKQLNAVVEVSKSIWKKYSEGDTLRIKYLPDDPQNYVMVLD